MTTGATDGRVLTLTYTSSATRLMSVGQLVDLIERIQPWSMGFRNVTAREVAELQDFTDLARESVGGDLGAHAVAALRLLDTFRVEAV